MIKNAFQGPSQVAKGSLFGLLAFFFMAHQEHEVRSVK